MRGSGKVPVVIVTGFLGSGKTTLLKSLFEQDTFKRTAIIVNEFGVVSIDHHLLKGATERVSLIGGGCACCQVREDLVQSFRDLLTDVERSEEELHRVVIETSGLADPAPIVFTILTDPVLQHHFYIDRIIVTVDAAVGPQTLNRQPESLKQLALGDVIVLTKVDLVSVHAIEQFENQLSNIAPGIKLMRASFGSVCADELLEYSEGTAHLGKRQIQTNPDESVHVSMTKSVSVTFSQPVNWTSFGVWMSMLLHTHGEDVLRIKGLVDVGEGGPVSLNGVQHVIYPPTHLADWPSGDRRSRLTFITRNFSTERLIDSVERFAYYFGAQPIVTNH